MKPTVRVVRFVHLLLLVAILFVPVGFVSHGPTTHASVAAQEIEEASSTRATCVGDGQSGNRVQVLYVRPSDQPDRFQEFRNSFRTYAVEADLIYQASAAQVQADQSGGVRYIRFVHDSECRVDVQKVVINPLSSPDPNYFLDVQQAVVSKGFDRQDRRYIIFLEFNAEDTPKGQSVVFSDDRPGTENVQHIKSGWAVIFRGSWQNPPTVAHELAHSLGAVQSSAPNALGPAHHCKDGYDLMCYGDPESGYDIICEDTAMIALLDCNKDDYFNTDPDPGNYLFDHWNVADSPFLGRSLSTISLDKTSSKYNGWVTATLSQFAPGKRIYLYFNGASLTSVVADGSGNAVAQFRTPLAPYGDATIRARTGDGEHVVQTAFRVIPRVLLNETSGQGGETIRVYLYGYAAGEQVEVQFSTTGNNYQVLGTTSIASNGRGTRLVVIPDDATRGPHTIRGKVIGVGRSATASFTVEAAASPQPTATVTPTPSATVESTATVSPTGVPTVDPTETPQPTVTATHEPTGTETATQEPTDTGTETSTSTPTPTETETVIPEPTSTAESTATTEP